MELIWHEYPKKKKIWHQYFNSYIQSQLSFGSTNEPLNDQWLAGIGHWVEF
jgi:hypothetical protein